MSKSRYSETPVIDKSFLGTTSLPVLSAGYRDLDLLENVRTVEYVFKAGDRFDHIAARFLGDDTYGWLICLVNGIDYPLGILPGTVLHVPLDVNDVLSKIFR